MRKAASRCGKQLSEVVIEGGGVDVYAVRLSTGIIYDEAHDKGTRPPAPPPAAPEPQLRMWHVVLRRRRLQMRKLSRPRLRSFTSNIVSNLWHRSNQLNTVAVADRPRQRILSLRG